MENNEKNSFPVSMVLSEKKYLLGILKVFYRLEDRRPDLPELLKRFKHQVYVDLFGKRIFSLVCQTRLPGFNKIDGVNTSETKTYEWKSDQEINRPEAPIILQEPEGWEESSLPWHIDHHSDGSYTLHIRPVCGNELQYKYYLIEAARSDVLRLLRQAAYPD